MPPQNTPAASQRSRLRLHPMWEYSLVATLLQATYHMGAKQSHMAMKHGRDCQYWSLQIYTCMGLMNVPEV